MFDHRDKAEEHKVHTGESLVSLADANDITWQQLCEFNWGTRIPEQINDHLAEDVGCTRTDGAGNYLFSDDDGPGIILIPQRFRRDGLSARQVHTLYARKQTHDDRLVDCVALPGATFKFGRSFIRVGASPPIQGILDRIEVFQAEHRDVKLCVFGHTDSADDPSDNKRLSERRAWALWAVLVHDPDVWVQLRDHRRENWDDFEFRRVRNAIGQQDNKKPGRSEFDQYFTVLRTGREPLPRDIFLKSGQVDGFMGCSEFNPLRKNVLPHRDPENQLKNEPNRRVMVFMLDANKPPKLPCRYNDVAPCIKHGAREGTGSRPLKIFSCNVYDRIGRQCDCEYGNIMDPEKLFDVRFQVTDVAGAPIPETPYKAMLSDGSTRVGQTDDEGYVIELDVPPGEVSLELLDYSHIDRGLPGEVPQPPEEPETTDEDEVEDQCFL